jgi:hypothetical protein
MYNIGKKEFAIEPNRTVDPTLAETLEKLQQSPSPVKENVRKYTELPSEKFVYKERGLETLPSYMQPTESSIAKASLSPVKATPVKAPKEVPKTSAPRLSEYLAKASPTKLQCISTSYTSDKPDTKSRFGVSRPKQPSPFKLPVSEPTPEPSPTFDSPRIAPDFLDYQEQPDFQEQPDIQEQPVFHEADESLGPSPIHSPIRSPSPPKKDPPPKKAPKAKAKPKPTTRHVASSEDEPGMP